MVSSASLIFMAISLVICFALPVGLAIYFYVTKRISVLAVFVGVLGFLVTQVLIRIPALGVLGQTEFYRWMATVPAVLILFLSVTAGLFEESGRWIAFRYLLRKRLAHKNAIAYGIGHGGFEAIFIVGFTYINNLVYSIMINNGTFESTLAPQLGPDVAAYVRSQLVDLPPTTFLVGGVERALTIAIQIGLSVMVYMSVRNQRIAWYWLAVLAHTLVNFVSVMIVTTGVNIWIPELVILIFAVAALWFVRRAKSLETPPIQPDSKMTVDS